MRLGLRGKILLIALLVVAGTVGAIAATSSYVIAERSTEAYMSRSLAIAKGLAIQLERILALGIDPRDLQGFEQQCSEAVANYSGLSYAMVVATDGRVLFHNQQGRMGEKVDPALLEPSTEDTQVGEGPGLDGIHAVVAPVQGANDKIEATVVVGFPQSVIDDARNQLLVLTIGVGVGAVILGLIILFLALSATVVRPLSAFISTIEDIRAGRRDYSAHIDAKGDDELGIMATGFNELLDRIGERERDLVGAKEAAEAASSAKSRFLAVMSHELRTPLNGVLGMTELLLRTPLSEKQSRYAANVKTAGKSLLQIIEDILDFSRIEAGKLSIVREPFRLTKVVEETLALFSEPARKKGLLLDARLADDVPEIVLGDPGRVRQILSNLVANAVKFTDAGVIAVGARRTDKGIQLSVSDTGIGIGGEFMGQLYESFRQADGSATRRHGGIGLGLAIVKQLVDAMGGHIQVESRVGQGTTFLVDLPLSAEASRAEPAPPAIGQPPVPRESTTDWVMPAADGPDGPSTGDRTRILLVEDNPANQELILSYLEQSRFAVTVASTGREALDAFGRQRFQAILMDWQLPELDGIQVTEAIRRIEHLRGDARTPIIATTAHAFQTDRDRCLEAGMDDYLSKPVDIDTLMATLGRWTSPVESGRAQRAP